MSWLDLSEVKTAGNKLSSAVEESQNMLSQAIQSYLDAEAKKLGYDSINAAITYADEPAIVKYQEEGKSFRVWRSLVWDSFYKKLKPLSQEELIKVDADSIILDLPDRF